MLLFRCSIFALLNVALPGTAAQRPGKLVPASIGTVVEIAFDFPTFGVDFFSKNKTHLRRAASSRSILKRVVEQSEFLVVKPALTGWARNSISLFSNSDRTLSLSNSADTSFSPPSRRASPGVHEQRYFAALRFLSQAGMNPRCLLRPLTLLKFCAWCFPAQHQPPPLGPTEIGISSKKPN